MTMQITLLGPMDVITREGAVALGGSKQRALLAMLALDPGTVVSNDRLLEGLWGDHLPASAHKLVQQYVSHLRKALAEAGESDAIATRGRGYELCVSRDQVDATRFERLMAQGAAREALALWRGAPLADVAEEPFAAHEIRRFEELRMTALEVAIDQELDAGRHQEALPEIEALLAREPLRERPHAQHMLALYRCGRQAEALEAYRGARSILVGEIGVEPGPELRRLHAAILRHDPALDVAAIPGRFMTPLLGRDAELERLRCAWRRAQANGGASVLLVGARGSGKTRLAQEFSDELRPHADVAWCDRDAAAVLAACATSQPVLVVVEDVEQAGPELGVATLRAAGGSGTLVLATTSETADVGAEEVVELGPLAPDAAAALIRFHARTHDDADPPVERLVAEAGGLPARLQEVAVQWAQAQGLRRLADAAARAAAERAQWRLAEHDLASEVAGLQDLRERATADEEDVGECPFRGLASFDVADAAVFFGRERLVADLVAAVPGSRLVGIVGPSGSGKSSVMRAGLLAALRDGVLPGSDTWPLELVRPGAHPLRALNRALRAKPPAGRWILAVDQFEELFVACDDESERASFVETLLGQTRDPAAQALVAIAIRADFYGRCAEYPQLARLLGANHFLVGPMRRHELQRAIELPAQRAGVTVEPDLVDALVADVEGEPGALPLLSTTLRELWDQRAGRRLTAEAYASSGGVRGAVARLAETTYASLTEAQRDRARRVLLRLAGDGDVRTRVPRPDLEADHEVVAVLAARRLLTVSSEGAEVAHEALLREWPRLRAWLDEDAEGRRLHRHLAAAAREWDAGGRDRSDLYRGPRLAAALEWSEEHTADLNENERAFLEGSRAAGETEAARQRRANRRLRVLLGAAGALLALAAGAGVVATQQRGEARDAALIADAQRVGAEALTDERLDRALLLARAGVDLHASTATHSRLLSVLMREPAAIGELRGDGWQLYSIAVSEDGTRLAIGDQRGGVIVYDAVTRERISSYLVDYGIVQQLKFSPDGRDLIVGAWSEPGASPVHQGKTLIDVLDPETGERRRRIVLPEFPEETFFVLVLATYGPDGSVIVQQSPVEFPDVGPPVMWRVDPRTGAVRRGPVRIGAGGAWNLVSTEDRRRVFVTSPADDRTYELDPKSLRVRRTHPAGARWGAVDPAGRRFALADDDGSLRVLDLRSGDVRTITKGAAPSEDGRVAFPDADTVVFATDGGEVTVWDVPTASVRERLAAHPEDVTALEASADRRTLFTAGIDAKLVMWDLGGDRRLDRRFDAGPPMNIPDNQSPKGLATSPDGRSIAVGQKDGSVIVIDAATLEPRGSLDALDGPVLGLAFSPDGRTLAVTGHGGELSLWDAATLERTRVLRDPSGDGYSQTVAFSPDGRLLATGFFSMKGGRLDVYDVAAGRLRGDSPKVSALSVAFSPDGERLAAAAGEDGALVLDAASGHRIARPELTDDARSVAFSPDGQELAVGLYGGGVNTFGTRAWEPAGRSLENHTERVTALAYAPEGTRLLTGSPDGTVVLWDLTSRRPIGSPLTVATDLYIAAGFAPDGDSVIAVPHSGDAVRWDVRPSAWERHACLVAGRQLTEREWEDVVPGQAFRPVCVSPPPG